MQTLNGKLTVEDSSDFKSLKQNLENLNQQFDDLEFQMTALSKKDKTDYLLQIASVQQSLRKIERIYSRLLSAAILTAIGFASWSIWLGFNQETTPAELATPKVEISPLPQPQFDSPQLPQSDTQQLPQSDIQQLPEPDSITP